MIPLSVWWRLGALAASLVLLFGAWGMFARHYKQLGRAEIRQLWDKERSEQQREYTEALKKLRAVETELERSKSNALLEREAERASAQRLVARIDSDRQRLRDQISAYATGASAAEDSLAAARERAGALGELLDLALQAHRDRAAEAESLASDVRALLAAWPTPDSVKDPR